MVFHLLVLGKAFDVADEDYPTELISICEIQNSGDDQAKWKYSSDNPLPSCIRKF